MKTNYYFKLIKKYSIIVFNIVKEIYYIEIFHFLF